MARNECHKCAYYDARTPDSGVCARYDEYVADKDNCAKYAAREE